MEVNNSFGSGYRRCLLTRFVDKPTGSCRILDATMNSMLNSSGGKMYFPGDR